MTKCSPNIDDTLTAWTRRLSRPGPAGSIDTPLPVLPRDPGEPSGEPAHAELERVRRFHTGTLRDAAALAGPTDEHLPALLFPFRNVEALRSDYPLALYPAGTPGPDGTAGSDHAICESLADLLAAALVRIAPAEDDARILKDNLDRLERCAARMLHEHPEPVDAADHVREAGRVMITALALADSATASLTQDLDRVTATIPEGTTLVELRDDTPLRILLQVARHRAAVRGRALRATLEPLRKRVRDVLGADASKRVENRGPEAIARSVGATGAAHIDPAAMARLVGAPRGAAPMSPERRTRLEEALTIIENYLEGPPAPVATVIHAGSEAAFDAADVTWREVPGTVSRAAVKTFDEASGAWARLFAAARVARLELEGAYEPQRHDALLESFGWQAFSREELLALPPLIAIESPRDLVGAGTFELSGLLRSRRPITVLVGVQPATDPGGMDEGVAIDTARFELGYLGISCREAIVNQSSAARPHHIVAGFERSCGAVAPSLHVLSSGSLVDGDVPRLGAWLHTGAALEGRAHPFFHYDPEAGATWARRFDITDNPQLDLDWPASALPCRTSDSEDRTLELAFTFADFALLEPAFQRHFRVIPEHCATADLVTMDAYAALDAEEARERIPFVWAIDGHGALCRLVVDEQLAAACRDRLAYWRTLQELAGVRNEHVREAVARERERVTEAFAVERSRLEDEHAASLDEVRTATAAEVMQQLARRLLGFDPSSLTRHVTTDDAVASRPASTTAPPTPAPAPEVTAPAPPEPEAAADEDPPAEPWIDSALCTSCNDCLAINAQLFVYNANKQAVIGDASAGSFAELVQAAEKCPAHCIHPGAPLNASEPGLEALIERARPFN